MSVTLWPWRRPICPPHFLITNPKHIKKTQSLCHNPNTAAVRQRKRCLQRLLQSCQGGTRLSTAHLAQYKAHSNAPEHNSHNTHSQALGIAGSAALTTPGLLCKWDWTGFLLLIITSHRSENPFAWLCFNPEHRLWLQGQQQLLQSTSVRPQIQHSTRPSISVTVPHLHWKLNSQWAQRELLLGFSAESNTNTQGDPAGHWAQQPGAEQSTWGWRSGDLGTFSHLLIAINS